MSDSIAAKLFVEKLIINRNHKSNSDYKTKMKYIHSDFSQIFNSINDPIILIDNDNNITQINRALRSKFGFDESIII